RRRVHRRAHQLRSGDRTGAADLRLRGRHHRWARQHVGHACRRHHPRRVAGDRRADQSGLAAVGRTSRLSAHSGAAPGRAVSEGEEMTASFKVEHATRSSRIGMAAFALALALLAAAPAWGGRDDLRLLAEIYAYVALASLWNLLAGYAGLVSVGQQAYVGLGGHVLFASTILAGLHPLLAVPIAGAVAAIVALPVDALMFRLRGHYFAIGTWVVAEVFRLSASQISALGGGSGISLPAAIVTAMAPSRQLRGFLIYWIALALMVAVLAAIVFFALRQTLADLGSLYLLMLGAVAIAVMLLAPKGIWGFLAGRFGWQLFPLERRLRFAADARTT